MKADYIVKNANIFTADKKALKATCFAVKDGQFVYVGDEAGLAGIEGEVRDGGGKFIIPAIIDPHVHVTTGPMMDHSAHKEMIQSVSDKAGVLNYIKDYIAKNPGKPRYNFMMDMGILNGETLYKDELDAILSNGEIAIWDIVFHNMWVNSKILDRMGYTDESLDIAPGIAYFERDKEGHITGGLYEALSFKVGMQDANGIEKDKIRESELRWIEAMKEYGVSAVFDSGAPAGPVFHEKVYEVLMEMDKNGELPIYIDGCYMIADPRDAKTAVATVKRYKEKFDGEHLKVHTLKIFLDGTANIRTSSLLTPYPGRGSMGGTYLTAEQLRDVILDLNEAGLDLHMHTIGDGAVRTALNGVEMARNILGDKYRVRVTCAHCEVVDDADVERFAHLGVVVNFTPWWNGGCTITGGEEGAREIYGQERMDKLYRCKSIWDTGALVTWSSDNIAFDDFKTWSPYLGIEVGITRCFMDKTDTYDYYARSDKPFPEAKECMNMEEMLLGYTINAATQLRLDDIKGSIEKGKDADYIVFDEDFFTAEVNGISRKRPEEFYIKGQKQ